MASLESCILLAIDGGFLAPGVAALKERAHVQETAVALAEWQIGKGYGLFARMTRFHCELVFEGSR